MLQAHYHTLQGVHLKDLFGQDPDRFNRFSIRLNGLFLDYSKNIITDETIKLLVGLAKELRLEEAIESMFTGEPINVTENRSVLHVALRDLSCQALHVGGVNVMEGIHKVLDHMAVFSEQVRSGEWKGYTGKPVTDIVNIGIGGSDLGPKMVCDALTGYGHASLTMHFVSNVHGAHIHETLNTCDPQTTLFMIASKTFTTQETLANAHTARAWFLNHAGDQSHIAKHFVALSTHKQAVVQFGIDPANMFEFWDFVGGRYSLWSAIGLPIACYIGFDRFKELLQGAHEMDKHFRNEPFESNIPVIMGLLGIWYANFFNAPTEGIFPYNQYLKSLPAYLQQSHMESNGKYVDRNGQTVNYTTAPILWGEPGTNGQHAFFQLLHQGTQMIPSTFIAAMEPLDNIGDHQRLLLSNFIAQTEALMCGKTPDKVRAELTQKGLNDDEINRLLPFKVFQGNKPTHSILLDKLTPRTLGSLIAMYEHKIFVQGVIWNVFSFDQWGVELGKVLSQKIMKQLGEKDEITDHDASTNGLINLLNQQLQ